MTVLPIDLTAMMGIAVGGLAILVPLLFALRFALKPVVEILAVNRESRRDRAEVEHLSLRISLLEQQMRMLNSGIHVRDAIEISPVAPPSREASPNRG